MMTKDAKKDVQLKMADGTHTLLSVPLSLPKTTREGFFRSPPSKAQQRVLPEEREGRGQKQGADERGRDEQSVTEVRCREENQGLTLQSRKPTVKQEVAAQARELTLRR